MKSRKFCIIGPGRLGTALAYLLDKADWVFYGAGARHMPTAEKAVALIGHGMATTDISQLLPESEVVFITTPDDSIEQVCKGLSAKRVFHSAHHVIHCSGVHSSEILIAAAEHGAKTGSFHPLQSFATFQEALELLPGSYCSIEGHQETIEVLEHMAHLLKLHTVAVNPDKKILYHAGAVVASNFLVALEDIACNLESSSGIGKEPALKALMPLIHGTVINIEKLGTTKALTGPFARGDIVTIEKHIEQIRRFCPDLLDAYVSLGRHALELGIRQGNIDKSTARKVKGLLSQSRRFCRPST